MNKSIYIILISLIIITSACNNNRDVEGIWITTNSVHRSQITPITYQTAALYDFDGDKLFIKFFDERHPIKPKGYAYKLDGNQLIIRNNHATIETIHQDTLILLGIYKEDTIKKVLTRVKIMPSSSKLSFVHKAFVIKGEEIVDSLDFINDSMVLELSERRISRYHIDNYKGLNILVLEGSLNPPLFISQNSETSFDLTLYYGDNNNFKMTEIEEVNDISVIYGDWVWPSNKENEETHIPPPPPLWGDDPCIYLKINNDSIVINQFGRKRALKWKMNSTNEYILFPDYYNSELKPWRIIKLDSNELIIRGKIVLFNRMRSNKTMRFERH
jgi:hypothetical protein